MRNATLTAATLLALKLAWRKFFALLAIGRRAEDMATTFQLGMLFDHYCAKLHVGAGDRSRAGGDAAQAIFARAGRVGARRRSWPRSARAAACSGRSVLEAPAWMSDRIRRAAERWAESGGEQPDPGTIRRPSSATRRGGALARSGRGRRRGAARSRRAELPGRAGAGVRAALARGQAARRPAEDRAAGRTARPADTLRLDATTTSKWPAARRFAKLRVR